MEPKEGGALWVGLTTPDVDADGPPSVGSTEGPMIVVMTEDVVTALTMGAKEATQIAGIVRIDVTVTL